MIQWYWWYNDKSTNLPQVEWGQGRREAQYISLHARIPALQQYSNILELINFCSFSFFSFIPIEIYVTCQSCLYDHNGSFCTAWIWGCMYTVIQMDFDGISWIHMDPTRPLGFWIEPATLMPTARPPCQYLTSGGRQHLEKPHQGFCKSTGLVFMKFFPPDNGHLSVHPGICTCSHPWMKLHENHIFLYYRTQSPRCPWGPIYGSWCQSLHPTPFAYLTDVVLADEDSNSTPADYVNRAIPGNVAMQVVPPGSQNWN